MSLIEVEIRTVYGTEKIYPLCDRSRIFCKLLGQSTLTFENIKFIKELGFEVKSIKKEKML